MAERDLFDVAQIAAEYREVVAQMNRAGVALVAGTDIEGARVPGFSLHEELLALVDAELTPLQALAAATNQRRAILHKRVNSAASPSGKAADLVLLEANPLDDIRSTSDSGRGDGREASRIAPRSTHCCRGRKLAQEN